MTVRSRVRDGVVRVAAVSRRAARPCGKRVVALHDTPDSQRLARKLDLLVSNYTIVALASVLGADSHPGEGDPCVSVAVTFDDGYRSWQTVAAPLLREREIPATFFVCSGIFDEYRGRADQFTTERLRRTQRLELLDEGGLRELSGDPLFSIGGHTVHHADLGSLHDRRDLRAEIERDRSALATLTGSSPAFFAYPFGLPANISREAARYLREESGYLGALTISPGAVTAGDRFRIPRHCLDVHQSDSTWRAWLAGGYDRLGGERSGQG